MKLNLVKSYDTKLIKKENPNKINEKKQNTIKIKIK